LVRIFSIWIGIIILLLLIAIIKSVCGDGKIEVGKFMSKNIINGLAIAFYVTIQDISFYCANNFYNYSFSNFMDIAFFATAVLLAILAIFFIIWQFSIINYKYM
jgi:hypothetical protein